MNRPVRYAFGKAHQIIWQRGCWKFLLVPIILSVVLAMALLGLCFASSSAASGFLHSRLSDLADLPGWTRNLLTGLFFLLLLAPCYVLFRSLVLVCYGPFLDRIAKQAETIVIGSCHDPDTGFFQSLARPLLMTVYSLFGAATALIVSLALGAVPVVGVLLSTAFLLPANLFLSSVSCLDPYLERTGYSPRKSLGLMWKNRTTLILFGGVGFLITAIPFFGWFIGPTYSVVAGVVLAILLVDPGKRET